MYMYMTLDFSDQCHPKTALRSAVVIGGWDIYMLIIDLRAFRMKKLESRYSDNIEKGPNLHISLFKYRYE